MIPKKIIEDCPRHYKNVVGVGAGKKGGKDCITYFVEKKVPESELSILDLIPSKMSKYHTDVIEVGKLVKHNKRQYRPVVGGISVGNRSKRVTGTLGLVYEKHGQKYGLSNNHVLIQEGDVVIQPGSADSLTNNNIGIVDYVKPILFDGTINDQDIATVKILSESASSRGFSLLNWLKQIWLRLKNLFRKPLNPSEGNILNLGDWSGNLSSTVVGQAVKKSGRTTGVTTGTILATDAIVNVDFGSDGIAVFGDCIVSTHMSEPGDSGSVLLNHNNDVVGLLFAGSDFATIYCKVNELP